MLLRVDMDALPIQEQNDGALRLAVPGVMHACGHDGHTAMGAAAARALSARSLGGEVRFLFQPAEEGEGGAQAVVEDGVLDGVDLVLGIHLWNELPVGTLGVKAGPLMAAVDRLTHHRARAAAATEASRTAPPTRWWPRPTWSRRSRPSSRARWRPWSRRSSPSAPSTAARPST